MAQNRSLQDSQVTPSGFLDSGSYLQSLYLEMKAKKGAYSYLQFASDLGFAPTNLVHQIIKGHRPLTVKTAEKIADALHLIPHEKKFFLTLVAYERETDHVKKEQTFQDLIALKNRTLTNEIDRKWLEFFGEWYHSVIWEMIAMKDAPSSAEEFAQAIVPKVRVDEVKRSLELLEKLGLIALDRKGRRYVQTTRRLSTGHQVRGIGFTRYHQIMLDMAKESLVRFPAQERDISAMTVSVDEATFEKLKTLIHEFQMKVLDIADSSPAADRVCQVNVQIFPFSKKKGGAS